MAYYVEVTDTYGGELNYCWVNRYRINANSIPHCLSKLARYTGRNYRTTFGDDMLSFFKAKNACIGGTVEMFNTEYHSSYNVTEI